MAEPITTTLEFTFTPYNSVTVRGMGFGAEGTSYDMSSQREAFINATEWVTQLNLARYWGLLESYMQDVEPTPIPDITRLANAYLDHFIKDAHENNMHITLTV